MNEITIIRQRRKTLSLQFLRDRTLVVKAPMRISERAIQEFIVKNQAWIDIYTKKLETLPPLLPKAYKSGESFLYLGNPHALDIGNYKEINILDGKILVPKFLEFRIQKELTTWYKKKSKQIITQQVEWNAKEMKTSYSSISFADTISRWGACTSDNHLQFNWRLIMAPLLVIRYVVELAHTKEKNHSSDFWSLVQFQSTSYKTQRKWLKTYVDTLKI